jgi:thymidylate synthase
MRSADLFLGVPFNIASYALLLTMLAHVTRYVPTRLIMTFGDLHIYNNHIEQVMMQLDRQPHKNRPVVDIVRPTTLLDIRPDDIILRGYNPDGAIPAPVAVSGEDHGTETHCGPVRAARWFTTYLHCAPRSLG